MDVVISRFIEALRQGGLPISPAETLDALRASDLIGVNNRESLRAGLALVLAKTVDHKITYEKLFDQFFQFSAPQESDAKESESPNREAADEQRPEELGPEQQNSDNSESDQEQQGGGDGPASGSGGGAASPLGQQLMAGDQASLAIAMAEAGEAVGVRDMQVFTQKSRFSYQMLQQMGSEELNAELAQLHQDDSQQELYQQLLQRRDILQQQVRDYVEQQFMLFAAAKGQQLRRDNLQKVKLTNVDLAHYKQMSELVRKAAKQLASMHSRRRRITRRGMLDVRKTVAANAAFDGILFHTKWKSTKIDRPKVMVICDVSGSVSRVARFLLMFLYSLQDVMPRVRSFVFASQMGEVTNFFETLPMDEALAEVMAGWANQSTSYNQSLEDFQRLALKDVDNKTTVIMLGDARNNKGPGREDIWQDVYRRSQRVLWLNPERASSWNTGDSIMADYAPYCSRVETCNSLRDLNRIIGTILKYS